MGTVPPKPTFFPTPADFRSWFETNRDKFRELLVGFYKKDSGKSSITWPESVQVALCFGWIDGVRKSLGETSYMIRFTPRKPTSTWSAINIKFVQELPRKGLMHPAGLKAFAARNEKKSAIYSYDARPPGSLASKRNSFAPTKPPGNFSVRNLLGTKGCALIGSSPQRRKKQDSSDFPRSLRIHGIVDRCASSRQRRRSNLTAAVYNLSLWDRHSRLSSFGSLRLCVSFSVLEGTRVECSGTANQ